jgi:hypothetical protein
MLTTYSPVTLEIRTKGVIPPFSIRLYDVYSDDVAFLMSPFCSPLQEAILTADTHKTSLAKLLYTSPLKNNKLFCKKM